MEKDKKKHVITITNKSSADKNETKGEVESPNGCVFIGTMFIIGGVVVLIAAMVCIYFISK